MIGTGYRVDTKRRVQWMPLLDQPRGIVQNSQIPSGRCVLNTGSGTPQDGWFRFRPRLALEHPIGPSSDLLTVFDDRFTFGVETIQAIVLFHQALVQRVRERAHVAETGGECSQMLVLG